MPIIKFWCLPEVEEEVLNDLHQSTVRAVVSIPELGLKGEEDMTCLFVPDMMKYGLGSEVIVEISGLFEKPERTPEIINRLATAVGKVTSAHFPKAKIECLVYSFNPKSGFWSHTPTSEDSQQDKPPGFGLGEPLRTLFHDD